MTKLPGFENNEFWLYAHMSDFVRVMVLLEEGGIYLDTDIVITKPWGNRGFHNNIAYEMYDGGRLNNNVLIFEKNSSFLQLLLKVMLKEYDGLGYEAGPELITRVVEQNNIDDLDVCIISATNFQPVDWRGISEVIWFEGVDGEESKRYFVGCFF